MAIQSTVSTVTRLVHSIFSNNSVGQTVFCGFKSTKAVQSGMSFFLSSTLAVLLFAGMQLYKNQLAAHEWMTIFGGFLGSILFCLILTAVSNLESAMFGKTFQTQLFPEVILCLFAAMFASGLVHRVCVTTCFLFSMVDLYYINKLSQTVYAPLATNVLPVKPAKKKN